MDKDEISEAKYEEISTMDEVAIGEAAEIDRNESGYRYHADVLHQLKVRKMKAEDAKVGTNIECAQCGKVIVKSNYNKNFCSNQRTHGRDNCKDLYHNRRRGLVKTLRNWVFIK